MISALGLAYSLLPVYYAARVAVRLVPDPADDNATRLGAGYVNPPMPDAHPGEEEKNLFVYWHSFEQPPPAWNSLCFETLKRNKGSFRLYLLTSANYRDFLGPEYVVPEEFYTVNGQRTAASIKDLVLFAALKKYGGIASDVFIALPGRFDRLWDAMVRGGQEATFYIYPWSTAPVNPRTSSSKDPQFARVWLVFSRRQSNVMAKYWTNVKEIATPGQAADGRDYYIFGCRAFDPFLYPAYHNLTLLQHPIRYIGADVPVEFFNGADLEKQWDHVLRTTICGEEKVDSPVAVGIKLFGHAEEYQNKTAAELLDPNSLPGKAFHVAGLGEDAQGSTRLAAVCDSVLSASPSYWPMLLEQGLLRGVKGSAQSVRGWISRLM